jgi:hypothetical protein
MDPPPAPQAGEVHIAMDAHRLGECPAGKAPGEVEIVSNGNPAPAGK